MDETPRKYQNLSRGSLGYLEELTFYDTPNFSLAHDRLN